MAQTGPGEDIIAIPRKSNRLRSEPVARRRGQPRNSINPF